MGIIRAGIGRAGLITRPHFMTDLKVIVAIKSCHVHAARRYACKTTWLPALDWAESFFIVGRGQSLPVAGSLQCDVSDTFQNIAPKVRCACMYALEVGAHFMFVCDDDTYVVPARLRAAVPVGQDYVGHLRVGHLGYNGEVPYAQGSGYWVSAHAMELIVASPEIKEGVIDDGAVGRALINKVAFVHDRRYVPGPVCSDVLSVPGWITAHKCLPTQMQMVHENLDNWSKL